MTATNDDHFELITAMSYNPEGGFNLLPLHLDRLISAHKAIATELPNSWCAHTPPPTTQAMTAQLDEAIRGKTGTQRVSRRGTFPPGVLAGSRLGFLCDGG